MAQTSSERDARFQDLIDLLLSVKPSIFASFDIHRAHFKSSKSTIEADVIIAKSAARFQGPRPVIVRIHGGFLVTGSSLFPAWFSKWILDFAQMKGAVIISPNYRLLPEVKGRDMISDIKSFWSWFRDGGLQQYMAALPTPVVCLNMDQVLLAGESAGGYLAIQSVLLGFVRPNAMITLYPMLDMRSDYYTKPFEKHICGVPNFPNEMVDKFIRDGRGEPSITEAEPPERLDVALAMVQNGRLLEFLGDDAELFVLERLSNRRSRPNGGDEHPLLPPLFILHGEEDSAVPLAGTIKFLDLLRECDPHAKLHVAIRPGDHGFDFTASPDDDWLKAGLDFVTVPWLGGVSSQL